MSRRKKGGGRLLGTRPRGTEGKGEEMKGLGYVCSQTHQRVGIPEGIQVRKSTPTPHIFTHVHTPHLFSNIQDLHQQIAAVPVLPVGASGGVRSSGSVACGMRSGGGVAVAVAVGLWLAAYRTRGPSPPPSPPHLLTSLACRLMLRGLAGWPE